MRLKMQVSRFGRFPSNHLLRRPAILCRVIQFGTASGEADSGTPSMEEYSFMSGEGKRRRSSSGATNVTSGGFGSYTNSPQGYRSDGPGFGSYQNTTNFVDWRTQGQMGASTLGQGLRNIEWQKQSLEPFVKDFYRDRELPHIKNMTKEQVDTIRSDGGMIVFGNDIPNPVTTFDETTVEPVYVQHIKSQGIDLPTPIQAQGIPMALSGRDIVGISRTGSGKTLAYILPAIIHINAQPLLKPGDGPIVLVLAPTRELVMQIDNEVNKFCRSSSYATIRHCAVFGGQKRERQLLALRKQPEILIATPGRLIDFLEAGDTNFKRTTYMVIDEADRMLDMGFQKDLENILTQVRPDRQTLMWSATWPDEIKHISNKYMTDPIRVQIGSTDLAANSDIHQNFKLLHPADKLEEFQEDIKEIVSRNRKALCFVNTKRECERLVYAMLKAGVPADTIHGDRTQMQRDDTMNKFRQGYTRVLIATDVVARGIDIRDIRVVINYDFPGQVEDYVHRIGRTARAGDKGVSLTYLTDTDVRSHGRELTKILQKSQQTIPEFISSASAFSDAHNKYRSRDQGRMFKQRSLGREFASNTSKFSAGNF